MNDQCAVTAASSRWFSFAAFLRCMTTLIVSHLPQNNPLFRQLGILVMWFASFKYEEEKTFYFQLQIISRVMFLKISNATLLYFLGFPYMVNVFAIVQALSLGAMECLRVVLLHGFEFRTARVLMFDLGWYEVHGHIFLSSRRCTDMEKCDENEVGPQFKIQAAILVLCRSTAFVCQTAGAPRQSKGQTLTTSRPASSYRSVHLR